MSNKVLITGLALGTESGVCAVCNYDLSWLLRYPSTLLWADKILVTNAIWDVISNERWPNDFPEVAKSTKLIFSIAKEEGVVEIVDPTDVITTSIKDTIFSEIAKDRDLFSKALPEHVKLGDEEQVPGQIIIDGYEYCTVSLWATYGALLLARKWGAHCMFDDPTFNYCRIKFGLSKYPKQAEPGMIEGFQSLFKAYLPNTSIFPEYAISRLFRQDLCSKCAKEQNCKDTYLVEVESNLKELFTWRKYDEVNQLKEVVEQIVHRRNENEGIMNPMDMVSDFQKTENRLKRRIKHIFPKVRRWANITTILSIPVALVGVATSDPLTTIIGAGLAGTSQLTKEMVELLTSKYNWVGFLSKEVATRQSRKLNP